MRLRRKSPVGRQRRTAEPDDTPGVSSSYAYRGGRSGEDRSSGRHAHLNERYDNSARKTAIFILKRFGMIVLLIAVVASVINILTLSSNAKVLPLSADKSVTSLTNQQAYETAVNKIISQSIWNHNKLTINTSQISQGLVKQFPELSNASITIPLLAHRPIVYVQLANPSAILVSGSSAYLIDASGKAILSANNSAELKQPSLPVIQDLSGLQLQIEHQALPATDIAFVQTVVGQLTAKGFKVGSLILPPASDELDVQLVGRPFIVKFNLHSDTARQQAGTFLATIKQLDNQHIVPNKYVDVRVDGRAYYQ